MTEDGSGPNDDATAKWWVYTPNSWPEPAHGPYRSHDDAWKAAGWLCGAEDFRIDHRPPTDERWANTP